MASIIRLIVGIPIAGIVTFLLFVLMDILISGGDFTPEEEGEDLRISISEDIEEVEARRRETQIDEVEEVIPPPPPPQIERDRADQPNENMETIVGDLPEFEAPDLAGDQVSFDVSDRDAQPLVRIPPQYPPRAAERGLEGHCTMSFDGPRTVRRPISWRPNAPAPCSSVPRCARWSAGVTSRRSRKALRSGAVASSRASTISLKVSAVRGRAEECARAALSTDWETRNDPLQDK